MRSELRRAGTAWGLKPKFVLIFIRRRRYHGKCLLYLCRYGARRRAFGGWWWWEGTGFGSGSSEGRFSLALVAVVVVACLPTTTTTTTDALLPPIPSRDLSLLRSLRSLPYLHGISLSFGRSAPSHTFMGSLSPSVAPLPHDACACTLLCVDQSSVRVIEQFGKYSRMAQVRGV